MAADNGKVAAMRKRAEARLKAESNAWSGRQDELHAIQQRLARKTRSSLATTLQPDAELAAIVGRKPLGASALTKKVWQYIRKHRLEDRTKSLVRADERLRALFGGRTTVPALDVEVFVAEHAR